MEGGEEGEWLSQEGGKWISQSKERGEKAIGECAGRKAVPGFLKPAGLKIQDGWPVIREPVGGFSPNWGQFGSHSCAITLRLATSLGSVWRPPSKGLSILFEGRNSTPIFEQSWANRKIPWRNRQPIDYLLCWFQKDKGKMWRLPSTFLHRTQMINIQSGCQSPGVPCIHFDTFIIARILGCIFRFIL